MTNSKINGEVAYFKRFLEGFLEGGMQKLKEMSDLEINRAFKSTKMEI